MAHEVGLHGQREQNRDRLQNVADRFCGKRTDELHLSYAPVDTLQLIGQHDPGPSAMSRTFDPVSSHRIPYHWHSLPTAPLHPLFSFH